jgi:hypothetical protein
MRWRAHLYQSATQWMMVLGGAQKNERQARHRLPFWAFG